jgi:hypothetical protein
MITHLLAQTPPPTGGSGDPGVDLTNFLVLTNGKKVSDVFKTPADMINLLVSNAFVIAGAYLFVLIIMGGYKFIQDESKGKQEAQTLWSQAGMGLATMFGAFWVIQIIQFLTGLKILF